MPERVRFYRSVRLDEDPKQPSRTFQYGTDLAGVSPTVLLRRPTDSLLVGWATLRKKSSVLRYNNINNHLCQTIEINNIRNQWGYTYFITLPNRIFNLNLPMTLFSV